MSTVVEFIGLCVFTSQVITGNNASLQAVARARAFNLDTRRVVAIMPRVPDRFLNPTQEFRNAAVNVRDIAPGRNVAAEHHQLGGFQEDSAAPAAATQVSHTSHTTTALAGGVEPHTAMLMFRSGDLRGMTGWTNADIRHLGTGWQYLELRNGDPVAFVPDLPNASVNALPSGVMHLGNTPLLQRYDHQPYAGAAAVFSITNGALGACVRSNGRIDTTLTLNTRKLLKITAGSKSLTLRDGAIVIAANIPLGYADTATASSGMTGASHLTVYCAMQGKVGCAVNRPTPPDTICDSDDGYGKRSGPQPTSLPDAFKSVDWSCSNSQWP